MRGRDPEGLAGKAEGIPKRRTVLRDFHPLAEARLRAALGGRQEVASPLNITIEVVWTCEACASPLIDGETHTCRDGEESGR